MFIRKATEHDTSALLNPYRKVSKIPGGLAPLESDITPDYVQHFRFEALKRGLTFVAVSARKKVLGEIHAFSPGLFCFSHVLSDLTIAVDPDGQGMGVGEFRHRSRNLDGTIESDTPLAWPRDP